MKESTLYGEVDLKDDLEDDLKDDELEQRMEPKVTEVTMEDEQVLLILRKQQISWDIKKIGRTMLMYLGLIVLSTFLTMCIVGVVIKGDTTFGGLGDDVINIVPTCLTVGIMLIANILPFMWCAKEIQISSKALFKKVSLSKEKIPIAIVVVLGVNAIGGFLYRALAWGLPYTGLMLMPINNIYFDRLSAYTVIMFIYMVIIAPITEEYMIRGVLLSGLKRYGERFAIITTSLIFGLLHGNFAQGIGTIFIGMVFAYITIKKESILPAIGLHMINNLYAISMGILASKIGEQGLIIDLVIAIILSISAIVILLKNRKLFKSITHGEGYRGLRLKAMCKSVSLWVFILFYLYTLASTITVA